MNDYLEAAHSIRDQIATAQRVLGVERLDENTFLVASTVVDSHAQGRQAIHNAAPDRFPRHTAGVAPELAFGSMFGCNMDTQLYRAGDGGVDFRFLSKGCVVTVDVKGARNAPYLLVLEEKADQMAHVLVLAQVTDPDTMPGYYTVRFLGWELRYVMARMPSRVFGRDENFRGPSLYREASKLRPMRELDFLDREAPR